MGLETMDLYNVSMSREAYRRVHAYLDGLGIKLKTLLLVGEEFLDIFALIALELDHLAHLRVNNDGAIASCMYISQDPYFLLPRQGCDVPNFFLMTLRIFFWSNFLGRPWTVVRVLRPLRSMH